MAAPWRILWLFVLAAHGIAGAAWFWLAPAGFPVSHPRFWTNSVIPVAMQGWVLLGLAAACSGRKDVLRVVLALFPTLWIAGAIAARVVFPVTFARSAALPAVIGLLLGVGLAGCFRSAPLAHRWQVWIAAVGGLLLGAGLPVLIRPLPAETRPVGTANEVGQNLSADDISEGIGEDVFVSPGDGSTTIRRSPLRIRVQPNLRFLESSPDGAPTVFVPTRIREGRALRLIGSRSFEKGLDLQYQADYEASLRVAMFADGSVRINASATLPQTIWSHLNSFCDIDVSGPKHLSLSFSPCPETQVEVRPMDYPFGRPLRFAYLDAESRFRVVEATSGEKGPFHELTSGPLGRGEPLTISLTDQGAEVAKIVLEDWSSQVDTRLSPTAGWGAPVNAIEFCLSGDEAASSASIYITLAATSVGRGWDCVGHRDGLYRNRVRVEIPPRGS